MPPRSPRTAEATPAPEPPLDARALEALGRYLSELGNVKSRSAHTLRNYRHDVEAFFRYLQPRGIPWNEAGRGDGRGFLAELRYRGVADASVKRHATTVRGFYAWLAREEDMPASKPGDSILRLRYPKTTRRLPHFLSTEEAERLVAVPQRPTGAAAPSGAEHESPQLLRDRALLELLYAAGLRVSEAANIDTGDLDLVNRQVTVTGKGDRMRVALFGEPAARALEAYINRGRTRLARGAQPALFVNRDGGRLSPRSMQTIARQAGVGAGIRQNVHPHLLRHTFATHMVDEGADLRVVQHLLGHASIDTTQIYTAVTTTRREAIVSTALARARSIEAERTARLERPLPAAPASNEPAEGS